MGPEAARKDVAACWELARKTGANENNEAQVSQDAANDAAALAVFGAATAAALAAIPTGAPWPVPWAEASRR